MQALALDGVPVLFEFPPGDAPPISTVDEWLAEWPDDWRALWWPYRDRLSVVDYEGEYPLRAHALIVSLSALDQLPRIPQ